MTKELVSQRVDKWLWHARFAKTRSLAQKLVKGGHVRLDREKISSASKSVKRGDVLTLNLPQGVKVVEIVACFQIKRGSSFQNQDFPKQIAVNLTKYFVVVVKSRD